MTQRQAALMADLEHEVEKGALSWLWTEFGYAPADSEIQWPVLRVAAGWVVIEFAFQGTGVDGQLALECRVGEWPAGDPPVPLHVVCEGLDVGDDIVAIHRFGGIRRACKRLSRLLLGPAGLIVAGDTTVFGGERHVHPAPDDPYEPAPELPPTPEAFIHQFARFREELHQRVPWLWHDTGLRELPGSNTELHLASEVIDLRIYANWSRPWDEVAIVEFTLSEVDGPTYYADTLEAVTAATVDLHSSTLLDESAAGAYAERLDNLRGLLSGDPNRLRAARRMRSEIRAEGQRRGEMRKAVEIAERAFDERDLQLVVDQIGPYDGELPKLVQMKLNYAKKRV